MRRTPRRFPEGLDPAATDDPLATFGLIDARFYFCEKIFARVRAFEIQIHLALADSEDVAMRIGHSGHNGAATKIGHARFVARQLFLIFIRAAERTPVF